MPPARPLPLQWGEYRPGGLVAARFGLREPAQPWLPADAIAAATVVLVPALAVDRAGVRLGRGAGFYDRSLPLAAPTARLVAVVRDDELVDRLPAEPHDVRMTHALTPGRRPGRARLAAVQHRCHRALLVRRNPEPVGGFDRNLPCDEFAAERHVGRQPGVGVAESLVEVGFCANGKQVARIVGEIAAALLVPVAGALVPGVRQRDDVLDLDRLGGLGPRTNAIDSPVYGSIRTPLWA